jgi:hypothetical protein
MKLAILGRMPDGSGSRNHPSLSNEPLLVRERDVLFDELAENDLLFAQFKRIRNYQRDVAV